ncbi:YicC/YloC family endoribonuclease [Aestuariibius sp. HNIBRBA575]|uniref:YicC/YloC family endoribonuclease n=1 Tax=Aestuariibius sp. HNIBRBA575 TaxID=3233343 RepID=UPI0034A1F5CC
MTAFATITGGAEGANWAWEMRGVNARGLDLRIRLPDGITGLEADLRKAVTQRLGRGNVTIGLRLTQDESAQALMLDQDQLDRVLAAFVQIETRAYTTGVTLAQPTPADVLNQRGVIVQGRSDTMSDNIIKALNGEIQPLIDAFVAMRESEGAALENVIAGQLDEIERLTDAAAEAVVARKNEIRENLRAALRRVVDDIADVEPDRVAQELALLAVKQDVTEEIDRLRTHVEAARALLIEDGPVGRKFDFLAQEFNREANTLCSKAQSKGLTAIGLDLKACIDQMREQIQNVE